MGGVVELIRPAGVTLGPDEGLSVRRTLPMRRRSLIGGWCFLDHFGPQSLRDGPGMSVAPHPHTGLQTASWLFAGEVEHRDSAGHHALVRPGELNLMTAGRGISHSEMSTSGAEQLHGVQLWIALPDSARFMEPAFEHFAPPVIERDGLRARVFLGSLLGASSPVATHSRLVGAELLLDAGTTVHLDVDSAFEHGVLLDTGALALNGTGVPLHHLGYVAPGTSTLTLHAPQQSRVLLIGGEPLGEQIVMWWNFIGRSHDEIVRYREQWQQENLTGSTDPVDHPVFGWPEGEAQAPILAPELPPVRLKSRA
ncbi:MAG: pirin family protein [Candidatus Nanopelagicales bacterium]